MWRNLASNVLTLLIVGLVLLAGIIGWGQRQYVAEGPLEDAMCLQVPPGSTMSRVADRLAADGAITNATIYRLGADYTERSNQLKAGSFLIQPGSSMEEIVAEITGDGLSTCGTEVIYRVSVASQSVRVRELDAATQDFEVVAEFDPLAVEDVPAEYTSALDDVATRYRVIVAEGVTSWQVVNAISGSNLFTGEVAAVPDEGSLAPDGYEIRPGDDRQAFLDRMIAAQTERLFSAWENRAADAPVDTPEEALILASIIEKETSVPEERRIVASVFANRLEQGIRLQTDPTVIYGITRGEGILGRGIRQSELRRETPWNTYVIEGLPPTPIANPGLASIEAALDPDETDYIFFVAKRGGGHEFAVTLDEHNRNVAEYRRWQAELEAESESTEN
ncbi:endolytic transglycosylase MltG [Alphaproteobacteria bacterium GH1-50]|uniref:Endolytic murein transglycosylase n=1 Tax=Kangsaoukella pontilimi TaxID=2691042 RepID=A0A7C9IFM0_9RHOB|nr:endolytic transglycosylase MltG [Kangsaoukella pontilimi]MXQ07648.1 endolytic transglycosylase MltG [Kangsaoukella pontilimi]